MQIAKRISRKTLLIVLGDAALLYAALWITLKIRYWGEPREYLFEAHLVPFTIVFLLWLAMLAAFGLYELRAMRNSRMFLLRLLQITALNIVLAITLFYILPFEIEPRRNLLATSAISAGLILIWRYLFNLILPRAPAARLLFLGFSQETAALADYLFANPQLGYRPVGFVSNGPEKNEVETTPLRLPLWTLNPHGLDHIINDLKPEIAVVSPDMKGKKIVAKALFRALTLGVSAVDFAPFHEMITGKIPLSLIGEAWFVENLIGIRKRLYEIAKRAIDIAVALMLALPALLSFPFVGLAIKLNSDGPIFFRQKRVGRHGREFWLVKYRSMVKNAEELGGAKGEGPDPRLTKVGTFLRRSYIDELPQLINILRGEMSFVGPRPERTEYVNELKEKVPFYEMRLLAPPGITGWAQIHMENDASVQDAPEKMQYDLYYVKNRSLLLDALIMFRTLFTILRREGR